MMKGCGFDGVELHFAHGYLGSSFLSARTNHRTDAYGGSLEKRGRLLYNSVAKTRAAVGSDFVVGVRMTGTEHMPQGITIAESAHMARAANRRASTMSTSREDAGKPPNGICRKKTAPCLTKPRP